MSPDPVETETAVPASALDPAQKRRFVALALVLILVVPLLLAEGAVRLLFRYNTPDTLREASLQYLPSAFSRHRLAPNQEVFPDRGWGDAVGDDERVYRTNSLGYRGPEPVVPKPDDTCRLVILGGSAVFDIGASEGADWPRLLEARLQPALTALASGATTEGFPTHFEVINTGVPGHTSSDAVGKLLAQLWMVEPDAVLLYHAWNDIKSFTQIEPDRPLITLVPPYDPTADPFQNYRGSVDRLLGHSQLYIKLRNRVLLWRYDVGLEGQRADRPLASSFDPLGVEQYRLNVEAVVELTQARGAVPIVATQASLVADDTPETLRDKIAYGYQGLDHRTLVRAMDACNSTVRQVASERQALLVDLAHQLEGRFELFDDHVHTNHAGSRELADTLAAALAPRLAQVCGVVEASDGGAGSTGAADAAGGVEAAGAASSAPASQPSP